MVAPIWRDEKGASSIESEAFSGTGVNDQFRAPGQAQEMLGMIVTSALLSLVAVVGLVKPATAQVVSRQEIGAFTYCSNGQTFQRNGNFTYDNQGNSWQHLGNFTYGSNGTTYQHLGDVTYGSDGTTCQRIGQFTYCQ
jgi:hypothetical protein